MSDDRKEVPNTFAEDKAFLYALAKATQGIVEEKDMRSDWAEAGTLRLHINDCSWTWVYGLGGKLQTSSRFDPSPSAALDSARMVSLGELRRVAESSGGPGAREVLAFLWHAGNPRTSETWEIWPRLWLGRTPEPGEHIDHDWLVRLAQPLAPGVTCREKVHDECFEDSEEKQHWPFALVTAEHLSQDIAEQWHAGKSIRIGCLAGMNRSALVLGAVLCRLGMTGEEAVAQIRWKRGKYALSNAVFHRWLVEDFGPRMAALRTQKDPPP